MNWKEDAWRPFRAGWKVGVWNPFLMGMAVSAFIIAGIAFLMALHP